MWETIRGYLTFTRKERIGVLFLLLLISILFVLPYFFRPSVGDPDPAAYEKMKEGIRKFESRTMDSSLELSKDSSNNDQKHVASAQPEGNKHPAGQVEIFYFDPNRISAEDWMQLGLSERLSQTILHYIQKGGRFRKAEDLKKLYGLHAADYERLYPYVRIAKSPQNIPDHSEYNAKFTYNMSAVKKADSFLNIRKVFRDSGTVFFHTAKKLEPTDINLADSADWSRLPGIGAKLASRIVHFREKLGGFYQVEQVAETFGLPDSTFQKIKPVLRLQAVSLVQIDLNSATKENLQSHPYIRWQIAKAIVEYRLRHGGFNSLDELLQLAQIDSSKFEKLKPYLFVKH